METHQTDFYSAAPAPPISNFNALHVAWVRAVETTALTRKGSLLESERGVHAIVQGVPLSMLQRWLGHAQLSTTALYAEAVGKEEQHIAARMWG